MAKGDARTHGPIVPKVVIRAFICDRSKGVACLFLVQATVAPALARIPFARVRLSGTRRAAEVTDCAGLAVINLFDPARGYRTEFLRTHDLGDTVPGQISAAKSGYSDELAARVKIAIRGKREEATPCAARRDVTHLPSSGWCQDRQQCIREVGDHELSAG